MELYPLRPTGRDSAESGRRRRMFDLEHGRHRKTFTHEKQVSADHRLPGGRLEEVR